MTVDAFLTQYRTLLERIEKNSARLQRMQNQADAIASVWGEHRSAHSQDAPYVRMLAEIDELARNLKQDTEIMPYLQAQVLDMIYSLPHEPMRNVLEQRYLNGKTYYQIAKFLKMDRATAKRWQIRALAILNVPDQPILIS